MRSNFLAIGIVALFLANCDDGKSASNNRNNADPQPVDPACASVRLTSYTAAAGGWCEFDRTLPILPAFVREGMTTAIAEPWNGGSYQGEPGEACGECWEIDTLGGTQIVMVHDLCPIEGNPVCAGSHFHFDLASEVARRLALDGLDEGRARRVPCPVAGNIHVQILDWNQWGYVRGQFVNHRIPVRSAELRFSSMPEGAWHPMTRSGGAWHALDAPAPQSGDTISFRLTTARGEVLVSANPVRLLDTSSNVFDLGMQASDTGEPPAGECRFLPPADVYADGWGGIDRVRWMPNPWGDVDVNEVHDGCHEGSASCLRVTGMERWGGMHIYYRQEFPPSLYRTISFWMRSEGAPMTFAFSLSGSGGNCLETTVTVPAEWTHFSVTLSDACALVDAINTLTWQNTAEKSAFRMDDIRFE